MLTLRFAFVDVIIQVGRGEIKIYNFKLLPLTLKLAAAI
jgi:hypothetical protein